MALIHCPECNREISEAAESCLYCGLPRAMYFSYNETQNMPTYSPFVGDESQTTQQKHKGGRRKLRLYKRLFYVFLCISIVELAFIVMLATKNDQPQRELRNQEHREENRAQGSEFPSDATSDNKGIVQKEATEYSKEDVAELCGRVIEEKIGESGIWFSQRQGERGDYWASLFLPHTKKDIGTLIETSENFVIYYNDTKQQTKDLSWLFKEMYDGSGHTDTNAYIEVYSSDDLLVMSFRNGEVIHDMAEDNW